MTDSNSEPFLEDIRDYIQEIGNELLKDDLEIGPSGSGTAFRCRHGNNIYLITKTPNRRYLQIIYIIDLSSGLGKSLTSNQVNELVNETNREEQDKIQTAGEILLNRVSEPYMERLVANTFMFASSTETSTTLDRNDEGSLISVEIRRKIFPQEEEYSLSTFNYDVQKVISRGAKVRSYLQRAVAIQAEEDAPSEEWQAVVNFDIF